MNSYIKRYIPPYDEFEVDSCFLPKEMSTVFPAALGPSIFLVAAGKGKIRAGSSPNEGPVSEGDVLFVPANREINLTSVTELQVYRAGVNGRFFKPL